MIFIATTQSLLRFNKRKKEIKNKERKGGLTTIHFPAQSLGSHIEHIHSTYHILLKMEIDI